MPGTTDVKINSVCPGWVQTDLGGSDATLTVAEGARSIVWAARLPADGPSGGCFRHGEPIPWGRRRPASAAMNADSPLRRLLPLALAAGLLYVASLAVTRLPCWALFALLVPVAC